MANKTRYTVTIDMYIDAENDYIARKKAHSVTDNIEGYNEGYKVAVLEIEETPFSSFQTRKLEDISKPKTVTLNDEKWNENDDLPF